MTTVLPATVTMHIPPHMRPDFINNSMAMRETNTTIMTVALGVIAAVGALIALSLNSFITVVGSSAS